ncbi:MAG: Ig-like domain-containing protein [Niabella sp.]
MRKLTITIAVLTLLFTACSKKDNAPSLSLSAERNDIKYDEAAQISTSTGSSGEYEWSSSDEFVGTVSQGGLFTADHIGNTTITAKKGNLTATYKLTVSPRETFFMEPFVEIGAFKSTTKAKEKRTLYSETESVLYYKDPSPSIRNGIIYVFDAGKMTGAIVMFTATSANATKVGTYYAERYLYMGSSSDIIFLSDNKKRYNIGIDPNDETLGFCSIYFENTSSFAAKANILQRAKELINIKNEKQ